MRCGDRARNRRCYCLGRHCGRFYGGAGSGQVDAVATFLFGLLAVYIALGCLVAIGFVAFGVTTVQAAPVTVGARILLLPAATALWPIVLSRWFKSRRVS